MGRGKKSTLGGLEVSMVFIAKCVPAICILGGILLFLISGIFPMGSTDKDAIRTFSYVLVIVGAILQVLWLIFRK